MNEEQRFISFYDETSDNFYELLNGVRVYLKNNNEQYMDLYKKIHNILDCTLTYKNY